MTDEDSTETPGVYPAYDYGVHSNVKAVVSEDWGTTWSSPSVLVVSQAPQERFASWSGLCRLRDDGLLCAFTDGPWGEVSYESVKCTRAKLVDALPIEDHFDHLNLDGTPFMWGLFGTWEIASADSHGKVFKGTSPSIYEPVEAFRVEKGWTWPFQQDRTMDYIVQADVKVTSPTAAAGVCLRVERTALGEASYGCLLDASQDLFIFYGRYWIGSPYYSWFWQTLASVSVPDPTNQWHTIKVKAAGTTFECYLDGVLKFTVCDEVSYDDGGIALWVEEGAALFDNVNVVDLRQ